jgi:hypothetical protein
MTQESQCPICGESLSDAQWRGKEVDSPGAKRFRAEFRSCPCCSRHIGEHVFYHWSRFGYAPSRETIEHAGLQDTCSRCRHTHEHNTIGPLGGDLHGGADSLGDEVDEIDDAVRAMLEQAVSPADVDSRISQIEAALAQSRDVYSRSLVSALLRNDRPIVHALKERARYRCQFEGCRATIQTRSGTPYVEVAHLTPVSAGGQPTSLNLVVLCPNHHKMIDYGDLVISKSDAVEVTGTLNGSPIRIKR